MKNIPKICHLMWDGYPMAELNTFTPLTFHRLNPDWKIIVHLTKQKPEELGKNVYVPEYKGKDYFHLVREMDFVEIREVDLIELEINTAMPACSNSDMFRRRILYEEGGVWSDFDVIWLRPMSHFVNIDCKGDPNDFEGTVSFHQYTHGFHNISNIVSEKGSGFIKSLIDFEKTIEPPYEHQSYGSSMLNKRYPTYESVIKEHPRMLAIPYETFYPYSILNMNQLWKRVNLSLIESKNVMCVHWFNGHRLTQQFLAIGDYYKCSMTQILKQQKLI